ncbi:MAG: peptide/nickel transport system substrate-binding protein, partial [Pseudonocardiales bacterium]|nr:peptide/nickel transport system substrate-binding protein [Pseudonocardiales bacterium]
MNNGYGRRPHREMCGLSKGCLMVHSVTARRRWVAAIGFLSVSALALSGCAQSQRDSGGGGKEGGTLTFGAAGAPKLFDPFYATDGETFRVSRQMFEGL